MNKMKTANEYIKYLAKYGEFVEWSWCKSHIDSMELADFTFDGFNELLFKKENK